MSWYSQGYDEAEKMSQQGSGRRKARNIWTKPGESANIRFLQSARDSFNYKRAYVPSAPKGQKFITSPSVHPDPIVEAGYNLVSTFAYKVLDRRILEFKNQQGEDVKIGPRLGYITFGQRDRKGLIAFEKEMLDQRNEELKEDGKDPVTLDEYNIKSYDIKIVKPKDAPWQFFAVRGGQPKKLSKADEEILEKEQFDIVEEVKPLPVDQIKAIVSKGLVEETTSTKAEEVYSYGDEREDEPTFFDK